MVYLLTAVLAKAVFDPAHAGARIGCFPRYMWGAAAKVWENKKFAIGRAAHPLVGRPNRERAHAQFAGTEIVGGLKKPGAAGAPPGIFEPPPH